jgi:NAD(P)-dependent dehydrogenase (short-subunit alcohol dehydrogenase family)
MSFGATLRQANVLIVGASQGIGLGFVRQLLADGRIAKIYGTYRQPATAEALFALQSKYPERLALLELDVTQEPQMEQAIATLQQQSDRLHLVIYCVGLLHSDSMQPEKSLRQLNADQLLQYFQVNSIGAALLAKHLLPLLKHDQPSVYGAISAKTGWAAGMAIGPRRRR